MNRKQWAILAAGAGVLCAVALMAVSSLVARRADDVQAQWNALADAYFSQVYFLYNPRTNYSSFAFCSPAAIILSDK